MIDALPLGEIGWQHAPWDPTFGHIKDGIEHFPHTKFARSAAAFSGWDHLFDPLPFFVGQVAWIYFFAHLPILHNLRRLFRQALRSRPDVAGLASDDGAVVMNPYCLLSEEEREAVALNEAARVVMSTRADLRPDFALTPEQEAAFANYGPPEAVKATVAARVLSGDPSALIPTAEQMAFVVRLAREMGIPAHALAFAANRISSRNSPRRLSEN